LFWNACSLSNFMHFNPPVIQYHIVHLFHDFWCCCTFGLPSHGTSSRLVRPRLNSAAPTFKLGSPFLNCWKQRRRVPINGYELWMNFIWR
jgi:hypothetical protein